MPANLTSADVQSLIELITANFGLLLSPPDAAKVIRSTPATLASWRCRKNGGPAWTKIGGSVRYRADSLARFIADNTIQPLNFSHNE